MGLRVRLYSGLLGAACVGAAVSGCASGTGLTSSLQSPFSSTAKKTPKADRDLKNPSRTHLAYAKWLEQTGQNSAARESYEIALGENPKSVEAILGIARLDSQAGRAAEAERGFERAIAMAPDSAKTLNSVGQFYATQKQWPKAIDLLSRAARNDPDEAMYRYHLAVALARSGDIDAAAPHFVHAVGEAEAHYNIGYIQYENGQIAASERRFAHALALKPELSEAQTMLKRIQQDRGQSQPMLAGGTRPKPRYEELAPPSTPSTPSIRVAQPGAPTMPPVQQPAPQQGWGQPAADRALTPVAHVPSPGSWQGSGVQPAAGYQPRSSAPAPAAAPPAGMTPQQIEQWRNQQDSLR